MVRLHHLGAAAHPLPPLRGYRHIVPALEGQAMHFGTFGDPFLFHFAVETPARVSLVCENCDDIVSASNEIYGVLIS